MFRRFEVRTRLLGSEPGIFFKPGRASFPVEGTRAKLANFVRDYVIDPRIARLGAADVGTENDAATAKRTAAVADYLNGGGVQTGRLLQYLEDRGEQPALLASLARMLTDWRTATNVPRRQAAFADAFAWSRARVQVGRCLGANGGARERTRGVSPRDTRASEQLHYKTVLDAVWLSRWVTTRSVHIFIGTKIEAVAGTCVLLDLPTP